MQPQGQAQIIVNRVDYGLDVQAAGDAPRWQHEGSSESDGRGRQEHRRHRPARLETGVPDATARRWPTWAGGSARRDGGFGRYSSVERRESGGELRLRRGVGRPRGRHRPRLLKSSVRGQTVVPRATWRRQRLQRFKNRCFLGKKWWAWQGLNLRPLRCQHSALPLSYTPTRWDPITTREARGNPPPDGRRDIWGGL